MRALIGITGLAAFVGFCLYKGQCARKAKTEVKEDLRRWEGEGGNVPAVATPSPAPAAQVSYPAPGSEARH
jgi:hypothetical protein